MSILSVGQGPIAPIPSDRPGSGNQQNRSSSGSTTQGIAGDSSQLAAQQFGARPSSSQTPGGGAALRTGGQPLNRAGRGQIVNIVV